MNVKIRVMSTFMFISIAQLLRPRNPKNCEKCISNKISKKGRNSYISHFIHFQSFRQKKWSVCHKTYKYRWNFPSKRHQTTSLNDRISRVGVKIWIVKKEINVTQNINCERPSLFQGCFTSPMRTPRIRPPYP